MQVRILKNLAGVLPAGRGVVDKSNAGTDLRPTQKSGDSVAKDEYDAPHLVQIETDLHDVAGNLAKMRGYMKDADEQQISLDLGTVEWYVEWLKKWAAKNAAATEVVMSVKKKRKQVKSRKAKS